MMADLGYEDDDSGMTEVEKARISQISLAYHNHYIINMLVKRG